MGKGRIKRFVKNLKDNVNKAAKTGGQNLGYAPLIPFKPLMVNALKKKGENVKLSTPMSKLAPLFRDIIVRKKTTRNYADLYLESLAEEEIIAIVREVLDFVKTLAKKKEDNERLSEDEKDIVNEGEKVADDIKEKGTVSVAGGNWFADNKMIIIGAAAVILFLVFRKK